MKWFRETELQGIQLHGEPILAVKSVIAPFADRKRAKLGLSSICGAMRRRLRRAAGQGSWGQRTVAEQFGDRREKLFGRQRDVEHLAARIRFKGRTAVVARPAMGKSWLLTELGRTLSDDHDPAHLVGFARSYGQTPDLRLRAVVDLRDEAESGVSTLQIAANCATILVSFIKQQAIIFGEGIV